VRVPPPHPSTPHPPSPRPSHLIPFQSTPLTSRFILYDNPTVTGISGFEQLQPTNDGCFTGKNGFVTAAKLGTTDNFFVAATKIFAAATKRFVDRIKHFVVVTKCFCYPYLKKNISLV